MKTHLIIDAESTHDEGSTQQADAQILTRIR